MQIFAIIFWFMLIFAYFLNQIKIHRAIITRKLPLEVRWRFSCSVETPTSASTSGRRSGDSGPRDVTTHDVIIVIVVVIGLIGVVDAARVAVIVTHCAIFAFLWGTPVTITLRREVTFGYYLFIWWEKILDLFLSSPKSTEIFRLQEENIMIDRI